MAECVSCGKDIPAGKLFCEDCYVKMKGKKGSLRNVPRPPAVPAAGNTADSSYAVAGGDKGEATSEPATSAGEPDKAKGATRTLTPTAGKKVVSIKPDTEKGFKERGKAAKTRFTITIGLSDRTYAALARLKRKGKKESPTVMDEAGEAPALPLEPKRTRSKAGPHGRPQLKAVRISSRKAGQRQGFFKRAAAYREHQWDLRDRVAVLMATAATVLIVILAFLGWVRLGWIGDTGAEITYNVKGISLGYPTYIMIGMVLIAWLYMGLTWLLKKPLLDLDFGVPLLVAGLLLIIILYITLSSMGLITNAAEKAMRKGTVYFNQVAGGPSHESLWTAYAMVMMGCLMALSGLARLSERRNVPSSGEKSG